MGESSACSCSHAHALLDLGSEESARGICPEDDALTPLPFCGRRRPPAAGKLDNDMWMKVGPCNLHADLMIVGSICSIPCPLSHFGPGLPAGHHSL